MARNEETTKRTIEVPSHVVEAFTWSKNKGGDIRKARVTIDLSELTGEDILNYALDSLVIKKQGELRRKAATEKWEEPKKDAEGVEIHEMKAAKPGTRVNADPAKRAVKEAATSLAELIESGKISTEELAKAIAKIKAAHE